MVGSPTDDTGYLRFVIPLFLLNFIVLMDHMMMIPLSAAISKATGLPAVNSGLLVSVYPTASAFSAFFLAPFSDRLGRKKMLLVLTLGFILTTMGCGFSTTVTEIFAFRILSGFFAGPIIANSLAFAGDTFRGDKRAKALATILLGFSMASIVGVPFGAYLGDSYSWQTPFFVVSFGAFLCMGFISILPHIATGAENGKISEQYLELLKLTKISKVRQVILMQFFMMIGLFAYVPNIGVWLSSNYQMTTTEIGFCYMQGGVGAVMGNFLSRHLLSKGYKTGIIAFGSIIMGCFIYFSTLELVPREYIGFLFGGIMMGGSTRMPAFQTILTSLVPIHLRGRLMSISMVISNITMGLGGLIAIPFLYMEKGRLVGIQNVGLMALGTLLLVPLITRKLKSKIAGDRN